MNALPAFLKTVSIFSGLSDAELEILSNRFSMRTYDPGETIIKQGEISDNLYIIYSGFVNVTKGATKPEEKEIFITTMGPGDCFGEAALFHNVKRTANIAAHEKSEVLTIGKMAFVKYLQASPEAANRVLFQMLKNLFLRLEQTSAELHFERKTGLAQDAIDKILS